MSSRVNVRSRAMNNSPTLAHVIDPAGRLPRGPSGTSAAAESPDDHPEKIDEDRRPHRAKCKLLVLQICRVTEK